MGQAKASKENNSKVNKEIGEEESLTRHLPRIGEIIGHHPFFSHLCSQSRPQSSPHSMAQDLLGSFPWPGPLGQGRGLPLSRFSSPYYKVPKCPISISYLFTLPSSTLSAHINERRWESEIHPSGHLQVFQGICKNFQEFHTPFSSTPWGFSMVLTSQDNQEQLL